jgi:hypothetical protein
MYSTTHVGSELHYQVVQMSTAHIMMLTAAGEVGCHALAAVGLRCHVSLAEGPHARKHSDVALELLQEKGKQRNGAVGLDYTALILRH